MLSRVRKICDDLDFTIFAMWLFSLDRTFILVASQWGNQLKLLIPPMGYIYKFLLHHLSSRVKSSRTTSTFFKQKVLREKEENLREKHFKKTSQRPCKAKRLYLLLSQKEILDVKAFST